MRLAFIYLSSLGCLLTNASAAPFLGPLTITIEAPRSENDPYSLESPLDPGAPILEASRHTYSGEQDWENRIRKRADEHGGDLPAAVGGVGESTKDGAGQSFASKFQAARAREVTAKKEAGVLNMLRQNNEKIYELHRQITANNLILNDPTKPNDGLDAENARLRVTYNERHEFGEELVPHIERYLENAPATAEGGKEDRAALKMLLGQHKAGRAVPMSHPETTEAEKLASGKDLFATEFAAEEFSPKSLLPVF